MKKKIVCDILKWIEINLNNEIRIDDFVLLSDYSRRSIQSIFKEYTGLSLGAYVRHRKLCRSATLLKLTNLSIFDIYTQLRFDSQSSFSREFKKLFKETPNQYRMNPTWNLKNFRSKINFDDNEELVPCFCYLDNNRIFGYEVNYKDSIILTTTPPCGSEFKLNLLKKNMEINKKTLFVISGFKPSEADHNIVDIDCIVAFEDEFFKKIGGSHDDYNYYEVPGGLYVKFSYKGCWDNFSLYSRKIYMELFPAYGLSRRSGHDIELFYYNDTILNNSSDTVVECDYYIPIH